jgi:hypothetical protein
MQMGTIEGVWRYPVKGMPADEPSLRSDEIAGSASPRSALDRAARSGVDREVADRAFSVRFRPTSA